MGHRGSCWDLQQRVGICRELKLSALRQPRGVGWGGRQEGGSKGRGHRYTDSCWSVAETNTIFQSNYPPINIINKKGKKTKTSADPLCTYNTQTIDFHLPRIITGLPRWCQWHRVCLPMQERRIQSLSQEEPLQGEIATHSYILAWRIPWTEEPGGDSPWGSCRRVRHD